MSKYFTCRAALLLAALVFTLSACAPQDTDPSPGSSGTESSQKISPTPSPDPLPSPSESPAPSPSESPSPFPSEGAPESASPSAGVSQTPAPSPDASTPDARPSAPAGAVPESDDVGNDWFSDAVFLGDSRTDGLRLYSGIKGASFICHTGLSVFTVGSNACINSDTGKITAMEALAKQQWAKVYLMLGVNELGYSAASFQNTYTELVEQIKLLQPAAAIYLQTLIPVNEPIAYEHGTNRAINNEKLREFNGIIAQIALEEGVFLVDVDVPFWSSEGCLDASLTGDGVHLTRSGYADWYAYLRTHTGSNPAVDASGPATPSGTVLPPQTSSPPPDEQGLLPPPVQAA